MTSVSQIKSDEMTVSQARAVVWMRPHQRPLGELLDAGVLTAKDLAWGAKKAFDPRVKRACEVLLNSRQPLQRVQPHETGDDSVSFKLPISLPIARTTAWPFGQHRNQPMGALVDDQLLSLRDLGYAAQSAHDPRVRDAATALMLQQLTQIANEPRPSAGYLKIYSGGRSFSQRREFIYTYLQGAISGGAMVALLVIVVWSLSLPRNPVRATPVLDQYPVPFRLLVYVIVVVVVISPLLIVFFADRLSDRLERRMLKHRRGREAEDQVVLTAAQVLDGEWALFRNLALPGGGGDLDIILVGPAGVWVLEVKNYTAPHRVRGDIWEYQAGRGWRRERKSPSSQARKNAAALANFLKADGLTQWITAAVVWANPNAGLSIENPGVAVWVMDHLREEFGNLWAQGGKPIPQEKRARIIEKLALLCKRQEESNGTD
jgi:hypothetical protein